MVLENVAYSLREIEDIVMRNMGKYLCCERLIRKNSIRSYDHEGGIEVIGFDKKQWVYFHCNKCDHNSSLNKVIHNIELNKNFKIGFRKCFESNNSFDLNVMGRWQNKNKLKEYYNKDIEELEGV